MKMLFNATSDTCSVGGIFNDYIVIAPHEERGLLIVIKAMIYMTL
jgi:hypothetical protein